MIFLQQKPVVEQLCLFLSHRNVLILCEISPALFRAFSRERPLQVASLARRNGLENWNGACSNNALEIVLYLHENKRPGCSYSAMDNAARCGHLELVQWLHENRDEGCSRCAMDLAIYNGHFPVVQWLHANRQEGYNNGILLIAATRGHFHIVQWLKENSRDE
jgi:hypothetical protein